MTGMQFSVPHTAPSNFTNYVKYDRRTWIEPTTYRNPIRTIVYLTNKVKRSRNSASWKCTQIPTRRTQIFIIRPAVDTSVLEASVWFITSSLSKSVCPFENGSFWSPKKLNRFPHSLRVSRLCLMQKLRLNCWWMNSMNAICTLSLVQPLLECDLSMKSTLWKRWRH